MGRPVAGAVGAVGGAAPTRRYEPASGRSKVGEAYALVGYAELLLAESIVRARRSTQVVPGGGIRVWDAAHDGFPLGCAEAHFDSAVAEANGNDPWLGLASVGLGRTLLDRGQYAAAATAVANVPTSFVYNVDARAEAEYSALSAAVLYADRL